MRPTKKSDAQKCMQKCRVPVTVVRGFHQGPLLISRVLMEMGGSGPTRFRMKEPRLWHMKRRGRGSWQFVSGGVELAMQHLLLVASCVWKGTRVEHHPFPQMPPV